MVAEQEINEKIMEIYGTIVQTLPRKNQQVIRAVNRSRLIIADIIVKYSDENGVIPRNQVNAVIRELSEVEGEIYQNLRDELHAVTYDSAHLTTVALADAVVAIIGVMALIEYANLNTAIAELSVGLVEALFSALTGTTIQEFSETAEKAAFQRKEDDDKRLNDRIQAFARSLTNDLSVELRKSIRNGEATSEIIRKVKRKFNENAWRIKMIVETELLFVHRYSVSRFAELSGIVKALRIVDYPHGDPEEHKRHRCYIYAHRDEYGLGEGIYPVTTRKIRNPHPRCRSTLHFVLREGVNE